MWSSCRRSSDFFTESKICYKVNVSTANHAREGDEWIYLAAEAMLIHISCLVELVVRLSHQSLSYCFSDSTVQLHGVMLVSQGSTREPESLGTYFRHNHYLLTWKIENLDGPTEIYFGDTI
jgi:hypothetical protein